MNLSLGFKDVESVHDIQEDPHLPSSEADVPNNDKQNVHDDRMRLALPEIFRKNRLVPKI